MMTRYLSMMALSLFCAALCCASVLYDPIITGSAPPLHPPPTTRALQLHRLLSLAVTNPQSQMPNTQSFINHLHLF